MSVAKLAKRKTKKSKEKVITAISTSSSGMPKWRQSPIDLNNVNAWSKKFPPLLLHGYWLNEGAATLTNTGRTVKIELGGRKLPILRGGPLKDHDYQFMHIQFRWGAENCCGAEHSIDNHWYSMEVQILHWNTHYGSIEKCYDKQDGIAILSYLIQVVGCPGIPDNPMFEKITKHLPRIKKMGSSVHISPDCLWWMMEACLAPGYYTYLGSLTTPPYHECVVWIVLPRSINISARQIDAFRNIYDNKWEPILRNYRCQQNLRRRRVWYASDSAVDLPTYGQSPIDLDNNILRTVKYPPLILNGHWLNEGEATLTNNGSTAMVTLSGERIPSTVTGGPLFNDEYELHNAHFHWGEDNCNGAEHTINGTWFSMEAHYLHWNRKYLTFEDAEKHKDGLVQLGYFFLVNENNNWHNPMLQRITDNLMYIVEANSQVKIPPNCLSWVREALHSPGYYVYYGSRTCRPFNEGVIWIIFPIILSISAIQMDAFRKLKNEEGECILSNTRPVQLLRGRKIFWALN